MPPIPRIQKETEFYTYFLTITVLEWIDIFTKKEYFELLADSLRFCIENKGLVLYEYVFMINHLHLIARCAEDGAGLDAIVRDFKKYTTKKISEELEKDNRGYIIRLLKNSFAKKDYSSRQVWQTNNFPEVLSAEKHMEQKANYIWNNLVKKGYVRKPEDWLYSSAAQRILGLDGVEEGIPIVCVEEED